MLASLRTRDPVGARSVGLRIALIVLALACGDGAREEEETNGGGSGERGFDRLGSQFQVNSYTTLGQVWSNVAAGSNGDFVVVFQSNGSYGNDDSGASIQAQRYASDGTRRGTQFQVNTVTPRSQYRPRVAASPDGDFVVAWSNVIRQGPPFPNDASIQARRFASDGSPVAAEFQVNTFTIKNQYEPAVSVDPDGDFVVVWQSLGSAGTDTSDNSIQARRYGSDGNPAGPEFQANSFTTGRQARPDVSVASDGSFVAVWESNTGVAGDADHSAHGRRFDSGGNPLGTDFQINTYTTDLQVWPFVDHLNSDDFVISWWNFEGSPGTDTSRDSVQARRYASDGSPLGDQFQVNTHTEREQQFARVTATRDGGFVVAWESADNGDGIMQFLLSAQGQRYAADGSPIGDEFQINSYTTGNQTIMSLAATGDEEFVVVWTSQGSPEDDSSGTSIQAQRFGE